MRSWRSASRSSRASNVQVILGPDEAWSLMSLVVSQVLDGVELSEDGRDAIKKWRNGHAEGSVAMKSLTDEVNAVLESSIAERDR